MNRLAQAPPSDNERRPQPNAMALIVVVALFQPSCNLADPKVWPSHVREDVFGYSVENRPLNGIILGS